MELGRSLSSKRSCAGAELVPSGLTERQALALALEESRRAAAAAAVAAAKEEEDESSSGSESDSDDESFACARGNAKLEAAANKRRRLGGTPANDSSKAPGHKPVTPRKKQRMVDCVEVRTATSSDNSKASRTTQLQGVVGACGIHGLQRGESGDSEHNSGSNDNAPEEAPRRNDCAKQQQQQAGSEANSRGEGAGESGGSGSDREQRSSGCAKAAACMPRTESLPAVPSKLGLGAGEGNALDPRTVAEMARRRRERFGASECAKSGAAHHRPGPPAPRQQQPKEAQPASAQPLPPPRLKGLEASMRSRSSLAELVESDLFPPETPQRERGCSGPAAGSASKTGTPTAPIGGAAEAPRAEPSAVACILEEAIACPIRTPSPLASSPHSLQRSEVGAGNACADSGSAPSGADQLNARLQALVKLEGGADGSCLFGQVSTPRESIAERSSGGSHLQQHQPTAEGVSQPPKPQSRKPAAAGTKRPRVAASIQQQQPNPFADHPAGFMSVEAAEGVCAPKEEPQQQQGLPKRARGAGGNGASRAPRSNATRTPSTRVGRWATPLSPPGGGTARRLRSAVQEELAHNPDAMDAYAWTPPAVPSHRSRASCLLAACAALTKQDDSSLPSAAAVPALAEALPAAAGQEAAAGAEEPVRGAEPLCTAASAAQELPALRVSRDADVAAAAVAADGAGAAVADSTPPQTPRVSADSQQGFSTPRGQVVPLQFIDFPTPADASALSTPTLMTPAATPSFGAAAAAARRPSLATEAACAPGPVAEEGLDLGHMLWRKLAGKGTRSALSVQTGGSVPATDPATDPLPAAQRLASPCGAAVASAAAAVCAAVKGRHSLEGRRLELSVGAEDEQPGSARDSGCSTKTGFGPFPGSRLGKALAGGPAAACSGAGPPSAGQPGSRSSSLCSTGTAATASGGFVDSSLSGSSGASFTAGCAKMLAPFRAAKQAPAWRADSGGGCGLSINPHLARQRSQRNLQHTWEDLLARQALEASTAEALAAWTNPK